MKKRDRQTDMQKMGQSGNLDKNINIQEIKSQKNKGSLPYTI